MSYAIIAGVIFAWAVCFGWAALEVSDARKSARKVNTDFLHNAINVGGSDEQYQSGSLKADWYLDKNPVGTYYEEP